LINVIIEMSNGIIGVNRLVIANRVNGAIYYGEYIDVVKGAEDSTSSQKMVKWGYMRQAKHGQRRQSPENMDILRQGART